MMQVMTCGVTDKFIWGHIYAGHNVGKNGPNFNSSFTITVSDKMQKKAAANYFCHRVKTFNSINIFDCY